MVKLLCKGTVKNTFSTSALSVSSFNLFFQYSPQNASFNTELSANITIKHFTKFKKKKIASFFNNFKVKAFYSQVSVLVYWNTNFKSASIMQMLLKMYELWNSGSFLKSVGVHKLYLK